MTFTFLIMPRPSTSPTSDLFESLNKLEMVIQTLESPPTGTILTLEVCSVFELLFLTDQQQKNPEGINDMIPRI